MLTSSKTLEKLARLELAYRELIDEPCLPLDTCYWETTEHLRTVPGPTVAWAPCPAGTTWGQAWGSAWFTATATITEDLAGASLYLVARTGAVEAMYWRDDLPCGIFNYDPFVRNRGDHRAQLVTAAAAPGRSYRLAVEGYAGHPTPGSQPADRLETQGIYPFPFTRRFVGLTLCRRHPAIQDFVHDLRTLLQLSTALPADSFRKGAVDAALVQVFTLVPQEPAQSPRPVWLAALGAARAVMAPVLACRNGDSAPVAGLVGHSHLDTAWHWTRDEGIRKCARTVANALHLMRQYPEYRFIQSSAHHADLLRRHYPTLFAEVRQRVAEGRWEPNGGVWVEPDVNLAGGEALVRQFLHGQAFTRQHLAYTADTFWLPDSFGYSAALPQILRGCGIEFFLTTKLTWNESNCFPYDTFRWQGLDGSQVFAHFNDIHCAPDPATLINKLHGSGPADFRVVQNCVRHKDLNNRRLIAYGYGDGGGGPDAGMLEMARRCRDLEGCPRAEHQAVSQFMRDLQARTPAAPVFVGELYFEGHRGTLTQMHEIKRRNRQAEAALHEAEFVLCRAGRAACASVAPELHELWELLLVNQFHDILPGTSIAEVHDRAVTELGQVIAGSKHLAAQGAAAWVGTPAADQLTVCNSLSWTRDEARLCGLPAEIVLGGAGVRGQLVSPPWGGSELAVVGLALPPLGARSFPLVPAPRAAASVFSWDGETLLTPWLSARFDAQGGLAELRDLRQGRDLRAPGQAPLNTFLVGEDLPAAWDNWDIDADLALKLQPSLHLEQRTVQAMGPLQFRLRQSYTFGRGSRLVQDVVFHAHTARVDFETVVDWQEQHQFLVTLFPLNLCVTSARHEVQFGHVERPTHRNFAEDRARFEVVQHRWTDVAENRYGVALLNDGKYGVSVQGSALRLSLHKGGCHPDPRGDAGQHRCTYALLPHAGPFQADTVVRPAYELNLAPTLAPGAVGERGCSLCTVDAPNVIVETVKPAAAGAGVILRLYEAERQACRVRLTFAQQPARIIQTNLLEAPQVELTLAADAVSLNLRACEIVTLLLIGWPPARP